MLPPHVGAPADSSRLDRCRSPQRAFLRHRSIIFTRLSKWPGLRCAVDRLDAAIERKDPILIYGDYDVDGTMAVIILKTAIELCGGTADFHVPHRIREGYDMRDDVIERAAAAGIRLIISVDMGIRAFAPAETAHRLGVDLIVTDHHLPGPDGVPKAHAVVNPNQAGCEYPYKQLCGAGVAFKVAQGLMQRRLPEKDQTRLLLSFMKVVAIATIADAVPLTGENRVFASLGLDALAPRRKSRPESAARGRADFPPSVRPTPPKLPSASPRASTPPDAWMLPAT